LFYSHIQNPVLVEKQGKHYNKNTLRLYDFFRLGRAFFFGHKFMSLNP